MRAVVFRKNPGKCVISPLMEHREKAILLIPLAPSLFFFFWGFFPHSFHPLLFMSPFHYCPPPPSVSFFYFFIWVSVTEFWIGPLWLWITACPFKLFRNQSLLHVFFKLCIRKFFLYIRNYFPKNEIQKWGSPLVRQRNFAPFAPYMDSEGWQSRCITRHTDGASAENKWGTAKQRHSADV